ncbi:DUF1467 family protein [Pseudohoeflea coraliihabitans]|uniref:DUF1467 family protein n=1 Tax=Pseudohoeflea coraliihabitans TaxID=2860393 RepID=A0ABS6WSE7_9HYPH|nr:DUF1467 family protein [Pseudohoeflea sp. DP4N28-3]MBW3098882.1 DUF1467 family protein [Pseudohoeflea sp. DP4N28-3]
MGIGTGFAVFFIIWWLMLFAVLPFYGKRSQADADDVTPGTVESAPAAFRFSAVFLRTTLVAAVVFAAYYVLTVYAGITFADVTALFPDFR